jgi:hypothetical protein
MKETLHREAGSAIVEFTVVLVMAMIVILIAVIEDDGVIDNLEEHEQRYIDAISAP